MNGGVSLYNNFTIFLIFLAVVEFLESSEDQQCQVLMNFNSVWGASPWNRKSSACLGVFQAYNFL